MTFLEKQAYDDFRYDPGHHRASRDMGYTVQIINPTAMTFPGDVERRQTPRGRFQSLITKWRLFTRPNYFVQCPCPYCGGMVSIRECMVQGKTFWFCTEESRLEYESKHCEL